MDVDTADLVVLALAGDGPASGDSPPRMATVVELADWLEMGAETMADRVTLLSTLSELEEDGLVEPNSPSETETIRYTLTDAGTEHALSLLEDLVGTELTVANGSRETIQLADADQYLSEPAMVRALARRTDDGVLYLEDEPIPSFIDREQERAALDSTIAAVSGLDEELDEAEPAGPQSESRSKSGSESGPKPRSESSSKTPTTVEDDAQLGRAVLLTGAAGVGKTTLAETVLADYEDLIICSGVARATADRPYAAFRDAIEPVIGPSLFDRPELELADPDDLDSLRRSLFADVATALLEAAADTPIVVFLDDLHHASEPTLEFVDFLANRIPSGRVLLLVTARLQDPDPDHRVHDLATKWDDHSRHEVYTLAPFDRDETRELIGAVLGTRRIPASFVDLVYEQTGGMALYVEELLSRLQEDHALDPEYDVFPGESDAEGITIPQTVEEAINTRLDSLDSAGRELLEVAGLLGDSFPAVRLLAATDVDPAVGREYLAIFLDTGVLEWISDEEPEWLRFRSGLFRETVVAAIADDRRRNLHRRIAEALVEREADQPRATATLAHHLEAAGEYGRALDRWREAGEQAESVYGHELAVAAYERGLALARDRDDDQAVLELLGAIGAVATVLGDQDRALRAFEYVRANAPTGDRRHRAWWKIASVYETTGSYDDARETVQEAVSVVPDESMVECRLLGVLADVQVEQSEFEAAKATTTDQLALAQSLDSRELQAAAIDRQGRIARSQSAYDRASEDFERSLAIARELGDPQREAATRRGLGNVNLRRGEYELAREQFEESLELAREIGDRQQAADALNNLGAIAENQGAYEEASDYQEQCLEIRRRIGDRDGEGSVLSNLGMLAHYQGEYERAFEYHEASLAIARKTGSKSDEMGALNNLGLAAWWQGDYDESRAFHEQSLAIAREIGDKHGEAINLDNLGNIASETGEYTTARDYYETSLSIRREIEASKGEATSLNNLGTALRGMGAFEEARESFEASLAIKREIGDRRGQASSLVNLGKLARDQGADEHARDSFEAVLEIATEIGDRRGESAALNGLGDVALATGAFEEAWEEYERGGAIADEIGLPSQQIRSYCGRAALARETGEYERAEMLLTQAEAILEDVSGQSALIPVHLERVRLALERGETGIALDSIEEITALVTDRGELLELGRWQRLQGRIAIASEDGDTAREHWRSALETFEEIGACDDILGTIELLLDLGPESNEELDRLSRLADEYWTASPASTQDRHRDWVEQRDVT